MSKVLIGLSVLALTLSACSSQNKHNPKSKDKGDPALHPTVTSSTWDRSETGPLTGQENRLVESIVSIEKIDYNTRKMTVRNFQGLRENITAGPEVKRFSELKVGDKISVRYSRSLAFEVRPPTPAEIANPRVLAADFKRADIALPPGMTFDSLSHVIVTIQEIDTANNRVTVRTPEGNSLTVHARYPENLARVRVGDTVAVTYGTALAIDVQPIA